jgi:tRNA A37 methylthiotransferase MiaB
LRQNQVDSDKLRRASGGSYRAAGPRPGADVVMVNTCAFIEAARRESVDTILEHADRRRQGARLVVLGCMAQRYQSELAGLLPEADAVLGMERYCELIGD